MTPDIGYFFGLFDVATLAHTLYGIIAICLPSGLMLQFLVRSFRYHATYLLPQPHRGALESLPSIPLYGSPTIFLFVVMSIVLGAFTHIVWDSFTHRSGWVVQKLDILNQVVTILPGFSTEVFHLLQHFSTALGLSVIFIAYNKWLSLNGARSDGISTPSTDTWRYVLLTIICVAALTIAVPSAYANSHSMTGEFLLKPFIFHLVLMSIAWFTGLFLVISILVGRVRKNA